MWLAFQDSLPFQGIHSVCEYLLSSFFMLDTGTEHLLTLFEDLLRQTLWIISGQVLASKLSLQAGTSLFSLPFHPTTISACCHNVL